MAKPTQPIDTVFLRNNFYRDRYRRLILIFFIALTIIIIMVSIILYNITHPPPPVSFNSYVDSDSPTELQLFKYDLTEIAANTDSDVLQWVTDTIYHTFTMDYINYTTEMAEVRPHYSDIGWSNFVTAITDIDLLDQIVKGQYITRASATAAPVVADKGVVNQIYTWKVTLPISIYFANGTNIFKRNFALDILVQRASTALYPRGMAIAAFTMTPVFTYQ